MQVGNIPETPGIPCSRRARAGCCPAPKL